MNYVLAEDYQDLSEKAAAIIADQVKMKPFSVLGLATGGTVLGTYRKLIEMNQKGMADFQSVRSFNLDEYAFLPKKHPQSYHSYMCHELFDHINMPFSNIHIPDGMAEDLEEECKHYEDQLKRNGRIDLQLLGIGSNGHIGFNEPGTSFESPTHIVKLTQSTRLANSRYFHDDLEKVPTHAVTMGIKTIMSSTKILILVAGEKKAEILVKLMKEKPQEEIPASVLKLHQNVTLIADVKAAERLSEEQSMKFQNR